MKLGDVAASRYVVALVVVLLTVVAGEVTPITTATANPIAPLDILADLPLHDASVGTMAGEAMAEGGAATYSIPIALPPGRRGMQPSLSLSYSSRSGAGTAGLGWSLGGTSSIHRCPRTPEQDGETRAVRGDGSDRLCLDGQRLIVVDPATLAPIAGQAGYGSNGAVYRTEVDSFARVTQFAGTLAAYSSCFKVESKAGVVRWYGGTASGSTCTNDARVVPGRSTDAQFVDVATGNQGDSSFYEIGRRSAMVNITGGPAGFNGTFRASDVNYYAQGFVWAARGAPRGAMAAAIVAWNVNDAAMAGSRKNWSGVGYNMEQIGRVSIWSNWGYDLYSHVHR